MPIFFFDFTSEGMIETDDIGTEFPSLEKAYLDACRSALEMSFEKLRDRSDPNLDSVEILDAERRPLMHVPFSEVLRPQCSPWPAVQNECSQIIHACHTELARGKRLKKEIDEELRKIQTVTGAIRTSLERLREAHVRTA
jgi:hypothetical protein